MYVDRYTYIHTYVYAHIYIYIHTHTRFRLHRMSGSSGGEAAGRALAWNTVLSGNFLPLGLQVYEEYILWGAMYINRAYFGLFEP